MDTPDYLRGPWLKLERAMTYLSDFSQATAAWEASRPYTITHEFNAKRSQYVVRAKIDRPLSEDNPVAAVMVGDCIHSMRSALDNAVWELARLKRKRIPQNTGFPIYGSEFDFVCKGSPMIAALPKQARAVIESMQPYQGPGMVQKNLALLNSLWNTDKHRHIPLLSVWPTAWLLNVGEQPDVMLGVRYDARKDDEVIAYIDIRRGAKLDFKPTVALGVSLGDTSKSPMRLAFSALWEMHHVVST